MTGTYLDRLLVVFLVNLEVAQLETFCPVAFMQIHKHRLLELRLAVIDRDGVVVPVQTMDKSLY